MSQILFTTFALIGLLYFLFAKRKFDYFSLAYISAVIYFLPGFFGSTTFQINGEWIEKEIHPEAYAIMIAVLTSVMFSAWIGSYIKNPISINFKIYHPKKIGWLLLFLSTLGLCCLILLAGNSIHEAEKDTVMENLGRWHILFYTAATLGLPIAYVNNQKRLAGIFFLLLIFDLYLGFRGALAIAIIATITISISSKEKTRLIVSNLKIVFIGVIFAIFFFGYKVIAFAVKSGMWEIVIEQIQNSETYGFMFLRSEPFLVQHVLNEIVSSNFVTASEHVYGALLQFIFFAPELDLNPISFNQTFQPTIFPGVDYGLAANIWAQMWSAGGWPLLLIFMLFFNFILAIGNSTLKSNSKLIRASMAPIFVNIAFYIHRNELGYQINIEKRLLMVFLICLGLTCLLHYTFNKSSTCEKNNINVNN